MLHSSRAPLRAGVGLRLQHLKTVLETRPTAAWFEIHPENYLANPHAAEMLFEIAKSYPISVHSVGVSVGSSGGVDRTHLKRIRPLIDRLDPILVFGASAIVDRGDVVPAAVRAAGGEVVHVGMPVDPGNLLMVGRIGRADVIGVPSCATSVKLNGFDWVLQRLLANLPVGRAEIVAMAPGGLLTEIEARPQPRGG